MNFCQSFFLLFENFFENIHKKGDFQGNYPLIFTFSARPLPPKLFFLYLDYTCHKPVELQRKLKHLNFGYFVPVNMIKPPKASHPYVRDP